MGIGTFQTPEVLPEGEKIVGVGAPFLFVTDEGAAIIPIPELYARLGVGMDMDLGLRMPWLVMGGGGGMGGAFYGDIKYRIIKIDDISWTSDFGFSVLVGYGDGNDMLLIFYPGIFIGTRNVYGGIQFPMATSTVDEDIFDVDFSRLGVKLIFGKQFGNRLRFNPAVNIFINEAGNWIIGEASLEFLF